ncbi:MAG: hypothetical protein M3O35_17025 [Acidobacteriota bacterium]|nr:hypothetical protein [Acidobacteriota bacterium]
MHRLMNFLVFVCLAQGAPQGDIYQSGSRQPPGDVYQSGGCPGVDNDMRHYIKNGTFDRCRWAEAHYVCDPMTKQYGMPVHIRIMNGNMQYRDQYARCGGDPCNPQQVVCWGWKDRPRTDRNDRNQQKTETEKKQPPSRTDDSNKATDRRERICHLRHLAALITMRYGTGYPIATYKVANSTSPTYMVVLSGVEWEKPAQATMFGDALISWMNLYMLDSYRAAVMDAMKSLPRGANLIIIGHSQGGLEAQGVAEELARKGFNVRQVVSYGAPIVANEAPGTNYLHVRAKDEPLQALDQRYVITPGKILLSNRGTGDLFGPNGSHNNYDKPSSGLDRYSVPQVQTLRTPCYEIDLGSVQQFEAPTLLRRASGPVECPPAKNRPAGCPAQKVRWTRPTGLPAGQQMDPKDRGLLLADENYLKNIAATKGLIFLVRDSSLPALWWIGRPGYRAKPAAIKGKTLKAGDLTGFPANQVNQYLGLASARGMSENEKRELRAAGYSIEPNEPQLIVDQDGSKFYSDTDLHGVYDLNGNDAWSNEMAQQLRCGTVDKGIQHDPHDNWTDRNNKAVAKANYGPQIGPRPGQESGDPRTITAILPDCTTVRIGSLAEMKQLYRAIGVNFGRVYPGF